MDKNGFWRTSRESLNAFAINSHGRRVWSLTWTSLKVKVNFGGLRAVFVEKHLCSSLMSICFIGLKCPLNVLGSCSLETIRYKIINNLCFIL